MTKYILAACCALALVGCPKDKKPTDPVAKPVETPATKPVEKPVEPPKPVLAGGTIESKSKSKVTGDVTFTQTGDKVEVVVKVAGAKPGDHAVHVHEKGDCSDAEAKNAGGHFNPNGMDHGAPTAEKHHPGDFGNLTVGADGTGILIITVSGLTVTDGPMSVVGKALVFHEKVDDFTTQPTGNAGARQGCAVISAK